MTTVFSKRVVAYFIDFFVVSALMWLISFFISLLVKPADTYQVYQFMPYFVPILIMVYFVLLEKFAGSTVGKGVMKLEVKSKNGASISWLQAIVRNLTKIYWIPIIFDWAIGKLLKTDRVLNNISKTVVVYDGF